MLPPQPPTRSSVQQLYDSLEVVYAPSDLWHLVSKNWIAEFIATAIKQNYPSSRMCCLNIGSAGESYGLPEHALLHVDLRTDFFRDFQSAIVLDATDMAALQARFTHCLCVGSVINHTDAAALIRSIAAVTEKDGLLILEFENSRSLELLRSEHFGRSATVVETFYQGKRVALWAYSENYISDLLKNLGFFIQRKSSVHHASCFVYLLTGNSNFAARFHWLDRVLRRIPYISRFSGHVIYECRKIG